MKAATLKEIQLLKELDPIAYNSFMGSISEMRFMIEHAEQIIKSPTGTPGHDFFSKKLNAKVQYKTHPCMLYGKKKGRKDPNAKQIIRGKTKGDNYGFCNFGGGKSKVYKDGDFEYILVHVFNSNIDEGYYLLHKSMLRKNKNKPKLYSIRQVIPMSVMIAAKIDPYKDI